MRVVLAFVAAGFFCLAAAAQNLDLVGVTLLRATANVNGGGVRVAQVEASGTTTNFEVNPDSVAQPVSLFTYISSAGSDTVFPNSVGSESVHADVVGWVFYGLTGYGVATDVSHVDNFDADAFVQVAQVGLTTIVTLPSTNINDPVVNSSFTWGAVSTSEQKAIDSAYDNYAAQYNTLFVSAACNATVNPVVSPPGTAYNCISVGAYQGDSSIGPTPDNGRCKPDITAPYFADNSDQRGTSFTTPLVAGSAALLMQAALRGDGGNDTSSAVDIRTVKALLLNGTVKPADWTNSPSTPLDARYGAGMLNTFNAYEQLAGGKQGFQATSSVSLGAAHPPNGASGAVGVLSGWDFNTNTSGTLSDVVNHYYFNLSNAVFTATATLVWNRHQNATGINRLGLFLFNTANNNLITCSTSAVDNVQHVYVPRLPAGRYDLQVWKAGGNPLAIVSAAEPYALAWAYVAPKLSVAKSGSNASLTWPAYPAGYQVQTTMDLLSAWSTANLPAASVMDSMNTLSAPMTNDAQFFRLHAPNF